MTLYILYLFYGLYSFVMHIRRGIDECTLYFITLFHLNTRTEPPSNNNLVIGGFWLSDRYCSSCPSSAFLKTLNGENDASLTTF